MVYRISYPFDMWICVCFRWSRSISFFFFRMSRKLFHVIRRRIYLNSVYPLWANIINFLFSVLTRNSFVSPLLSIVEIFLFGNKKSLCLWILIRLASTKTGHIFLWYSHRLYVRRFSCRHTYMYNATSSVHAKDIPFESPGSYCQDVHEPNPCLRDIFNLTSCCE